MRLIDADKLQYKTLAEVNGRLTYVLTVDEINNAPTVNPCNNCDLYFIAKTKQEMRRGGAE